MKARLHKIPDVDIAVCSAEQMIAYNFCSTYKRMSPDWIAVSAAEHLKDNKKFARYNKDAIISLIRKCHGVTYPAIIGRGIAGSYAEVGRWFPID